MARLARIWLTMLFASYLIKAVISESKPKDTYEKEKTAISKKEMQAIIKQKTVQGIKKLENQFKATFMAYTSEKDQNKRQEAHEKREPDVIHLSDKDTEGVLESSHIRKRRSRDKWGSCKPICKQRCLPTCNLVCCIAPPYDVPRKTVKQLEKQLGRKYGRKKSHIKKHPEKKKSLIKKIPRKKNDMVKKRKKTRDVCDVKCQKACIPSCNFRCCIAP